MILLKITVRHCKKIIPNIGDISIPNIIGMVPLNSLKYGSVSLFREQKGSLYQLTVGNHAKESFSKINIKYISEKLATDVNTKFSECVIIIFFLYLVFVFFNNHLDFYLLILYMIFVVYIFNDGYIFPNLLKISSEHIMQHRDIFCNVIGV